MRKNHSILAPQNDGIRGIFPVFYSFSTTHKILSYWKDHAGNDLGRVLLSPSLKLKQLLLDMHFDLIIPIPQHEERSMKRGHASALEVAKFFSKELGTPLNPEILRLKDISGSKQANLNAWERRHRENPFIVDSLPAPGMKKILIVDDFITSGSTLDKAANAFLASNSNLEIYAASLGWKPKTERRRSVQRQSN